MACLKQNLSAKIQAIDAATGKTARWFDFHEDSYHGAALEVYNGLWYSDDWDQMGHYSDNPFVARTDPNTNTRTLVWDALRRLKEDQAPSALGYVTRYVYDGNGNRTSKEVKNIDKDLNVVTSNEW